MKIYDVEGFPNPARVRIALAEKGIKNQVEFITVDVMNGEHRQAEFLAKNPDAAVPVLELNSGVTISECTAITEYIDHSFPGISLTGTTAIQRALVHMYQRKAESKVLDAVGAYFHHATDGLGPNLETNQNKAWGKQQKELALEGFKYFNQVLGETDYVAGNEFTMADITLFAGLAFADFAKVDIPAELNNLALWRNKVAQRPSIAG
ncbi:glutathione S-transferase [Colwellia sp. UCD-KL20]|uniref:glutathione S-transferase family protein n=1 Tax=Colwellia sp. UCD-KL20 TaxID=1917165 RepID=UPI000970883A|nr:glutathione S-transferase [Colwellia sp. UCD-KL20]